MKVALAFLVLSGLPITASSAVTGYRTKMNASNMSAIYVVSETVLATVTNQSSIVQKHIAPAASVDFTALKARAGQCFMRDISVCGGDVAVNWSCEGSTDDKRSMFSLDDNFKIAKLELDAPAFVCTMPSWNPQ